jgi:spore cortex protein
MIPLSALITMGLAGCANDDNAASDKRDNNAASPMGYYSNENHPNGNNGFLADNDGPLPELMDHNLGSEGQTANEQRRKQLQTRNENGNPTNPTRPLADHDHNFFQRDNRFSTSDANYHGHLNQRIGTTGTATNPENQDNVTGQIKRQVATVDNVRQVRSVLYGNSVVISVDLVNNQREKETKSAIQKAVKPFVGGRSVQVINDDGILGRDRNGPDNNRNNDIQHYEHNGNKEVKNPSP